MKPVIAISAGDPAGVGPEVVAGALPAAVGICRPLVLGHWPTLREALARIPSAPKVRIVGEPTPPSSGQITVMPVGPDCPPITASGEAAAQAQIAALEAAIDAIVDGPANALVTAPMNKALAATVEPSFSGHTEFLAARCGIDPASVTMVFTHKNLAIGLIATHVALADVPATITAQRYRRTIRHLVEILTSIGTPLPVRIALAAVNPHASEGGRFGREEREVLEPMCQTLGQDLAAKLHGPIPADAVFRDALAGHYDGVVAAYHDQAMIPLKLAGLGHSTNVTMGLPFVRTSPDHGVAYEAARRGVADGRGMTLALDMAVKLWSRRQAEV